MAQWMRRLVSLLSASNLRGLDVALLRDRFVASAPDGTTREVYALPHAALFLVVSLVVVVDVDGARWAHLTNHR